ncbi:SAM-dependent methyltransferase [Aquimarina agarilytica]|uniref:SAM-dependent methyltransferase n=1 Tax=Aquimarina agarilytica TaxID=1087449 RepID=UPI0003110334|nr:SAM-dependent methyltransferase [Aquimarina agarilytica]
MNLEVVKNSVKNRLELKFQEELPKALAIYLKEVGFKESFSSTKEWYADLHPAYMTYANDLKEAITNGDSWEAIPLRPSFSSSLENIDQNKFSVVTFCFNTSDGTREESYVVFDSYKKVAYAIAQKFGEEKYRDSLQEIKVFPRNYKKRARQLFGEQKIVTTIEKTSPKEVEIPTPQEVQTALDLENEAPTTTSKPKDIFLRGYQVRNVLVPIKAKEPFQSGNITIGATQFLKHRFKELYNISNEDLSKASAVQLFQLIQLSHPTDYDIDVNRSSLLSEWDNRGESVFKEIGFPTDLNYPYVNINTTYKSVERLEKVLFKFSRTPSWWGVADNWRPVADIEKGIALTEEVLQELVEQQEEYTNSKTRKPKSNKESKEKYRELQWDIERVEASKQVLQEYLDSTASQEKPSPKETLQQEELKATKQNSQENKDYLDRVVATMHEHFEKDERLSKKKIEALKETTGSPNLGMLWEAVELSWLLWYKQLYREPISFEARLQKIIHFWEKVQPTYAYSDSSKELYKQYSTPCPIGAMIAEYTNMKAADLIFEPSAGNGLLVMGADPNKTHVNEIDKSRKKSLRFQGFKEVTRLNAAEPFIPSMTKAYDVVVTNPPFAKWEASEFDKMRIIHKYFGKHHILPRHLRLEHLMSAIALNSMKDEGRGALMLMGHVYFDNYGFIAKYRPFFNWLYRHYYVDDIINLNSFKLYNKQGAVTQTMLVLINGRKLIPNGVAPTKHETPHLDKVIDSFMDLWEEVSLHLRPSVPTLIQQLKTAQL